MNDLYRLMLIMLHRDFSSGYCDELDMAFGAQNIVEMMLKDERINIVNKK